MREMEAEDSVYVLMRSRQLFEPGDDIFVKNLDTGDGRAYTMLAGGKIVSKNQQYLDETRRNVVK
jgi:hypothetical protein